MVVVLLVFGAMTAMIGNRSNLQEVQLRRSRKIKKVFYGRVIQVAFGVMTLVAGKWLLRAQVVKWSRGSMRIQVVPFGSEG